MEFFCCFVWVNFLVDKVYLFVVFVVFFLYVFGDIRVGCFFGYKWCIKSFMINFVIVYRY